MVIIIWAKIVLLKLLHFVQSLNAHDSIPKSEEKYCFCAQYVGDWFISFGTLCVYHSIVSCAVNRIGRFNLKLNIEFETSCFSRKEEGK
jgi:hypothetical protein